MLRPRSSKVSVEKVILCPFDCKPKPSGVSLESPELENIPEVPRNRDEVGQNHDARKAVSATLSVLSVVGLYFGPEARKLAFKKFCSLNLTENQDHRELVEGGRD